MPKEELNPVEGKGDTPSSSNQPPEARKKQTTQLVETKIKALRAALKSRSKDRFYGLPKNLQAFLDWRGEGDEEPLSLIPRPTLNSRKDLKENVQKVLQERKNTPEEDVARHESNNKSMRSKVLQARTMKCISKLVALKQS